MSTNPPSLSPLLALRGVRKRFGPVEALAGLDLQVHAGEVVALLGPNGAGKTTVVRALLGLLKVDAGSVAVLGHAAGSMGARLGQGVMLQAGALPETLTVREQLQVAASYYANPESMDVLLEDCDLTGLLERRYGDLSGGQKRRAQFALALIGRPRVAILDEPTAALDLPSKQSFWRAIARRVAQGLGVLLTTHDLNEVDAVAHRVVVVSQGRVLGGGTPAQVRARITGSVVRCNSRLPIQTLATLPGADQVTLDQQRVEIRTRAPEQLLRDLLAADEALSDLEITRPSLEDAVAHWLNAAQQGQEAACTQ